MEAENTFPEAVSPVERPRSDFPETPEPTPIAEGEIFDPDGELKNVLKYSGKDRERKFSEYKEKFRFQKEGLARMYDSLWEKIERDPDLSLEELSSAANEFYRKYGFTTAGRLSIFSALKKYTDRREDICAALGEYSVSEESGPRIDAQKLFNGLFGQQPAGKVEVTVGPVSVFVRCHLGEDYAGALRVSHILGGADVSDAAELASRSAAVKLSRTLISELDNAVTLENFERTVRQAEPKGSAANPEEKLSRDFFLHEEQHAVFALLEERAAYKAEHIKDIQNAETEAEAGLAAKIYFKEVLPFFFAAAKDEILASISGEFTSSEAVDRLELFKSNAKEGNLYDYRRNLNWLLSNISKEVGSDKMKIMRTAAEEVFGAKYEPRVEEGVEAAKELLLRGYEPKRARAMLMFTPFLGWKKEVSRLLSESA
jgi:hypothetical protein